MSRKDLPVLQRGYNIPVDQTMRLKNVVNFNRKSLKQDQMIHVSFLLTECKYHTVDVEGDGSGG